MRELSYFDAFMLVLTFTLGPALLVISIQEFKKWLKTKKEK